MSAVDATTATTRAETAGRIRRPRSLGSVEGIGGGIILLAIVGIALFGSLLAPHPLDAPVGVPGSPPAPGVPLGTDALGRDVLSRVLDGGLPVLRVSFITIVLIYLIGGVVGMVAGLSRSLLDPVLMRTVDIFLSLPSLLLMLLLIAGAGQGEVVLIAAIVVVLFPGAARIIRTATLEVSTAGYIESAIGRGERLPALMVREVLPNIAPTVIADLGVRFSSAIVLAASVNFLGLGSSPPAANWGLMVAENRNIITTNIWSVLAPAALLALLTISINMLGDAYVHRRGRSEAD
jgi:ABC-type dipeptide/oligopeptide/nickel transport system permease subunit